MAGLYRSIRPVSLAALVVGSHTTAPHVMCLHRSGFGPLDSSAEAPSPWVHVHDLLALQRSGRHVSPFGQERPATSGGFRWLPAGKIFSFGVVCHTPVFMAEPQRPPRLTRCCSTHCRHAFGLGSSRRYRRGGFCNPGSWLQALHIGTVCTRIARAFWRSGSSCVRCQPPCHPPWCWWARWSRSATLVRPAPSLEAPSSCAGSPSDVLVLASTPAAALLFPSHAEGFGWPVLKPLPVAAR